MTDTTAGDSQLTTEQAEMASWISACAAVAVRLRGERLGAQTGDPKMLARIAFKLVEIAFVVIMHEGQEAGRTEDETRADALAWLDEQVAKAQAQLWDSGIAYNPAAAPVLAADWADL